MDFGPSQSVKKITACMLICSLMTMLVSPVFAAVSPDFIAVETVTGFTPIDDQTATTAVIQANLSETKSSRTVTVSARPASSESITIGQCLVTFLTIAGSTADELDCSDNVATIDTNTGAGNANRTPATIAGRLRALTSLSDTNHGSLNTSGGGANAIFATAGVETSATSINFSDSTGGDLSSTSDVSGVLATAKVSTLTIGSSVEIGDSFTASFWGGNFATYTATTTSLSDVAAGLNAAIQAHPLYPTAPFTSSVTAEVITFTATTPGTSFAQSSSTLNASVTSQIVTFTPVDVVSGITYTATIDGNNYTYTTDSGTTVSNITASLAVDMTAGGIATCINDTTHITCTNNTPGGTFTFTATAQDVEAPVITLIGSDPMDASQGAAYVEQGANCVDNVDTSCTVVIDNSAVNTSLVGPYSVSYNAVDMIGNSATQIFRAVNVVDTDKPIITLLGSPTLTVARGSTYTDDGATAADNVDGDITVNIMTTGSVDTSILGTYTITYDVTDVAGNAATQVTRTISVTDQTAPTVTEVTPVPTPTNDNTPFYSFSTDEAGTITYGGGCTSSTTTAAVGANTIEFDPLSDGTYASCTITVTDAATLPNTSTPLTLSTFTIDTTDPMLTLDQSGTQADPTASSILFFTAVMGESILDVTFTCDDVVAINAVCDSVTNIWVNTYTVQVHALAAGVVTVSVVGGGISDFAGNTNTDSTSTDNSVHFTASGWGGGGNSIIEVLDNANASVSDNKTSVSSELSDDTVSHEEEDDFLDRDETIPPETRPDGAPINDIGTTDESTNPVDDSELVSTSYPNDASTPRPVTNQPIPIAPQSTSSDTDSSGNKVTASEESVTKTEIVPEETVVEAATEEGGGQPAEESSNVLPWTLLGLIALLNFAWFYTRKPPVIPPQG